MKLLSSVVCAGVLATCVAANRPVLNPTRVTEDMKRKEFSNLFATFDNIAREEHWNRAFGTSGGMKTKDFLVHRTQHLLRKHLKTNVQTFTHMYEHTDRIAITGPDGQEVPVMTLEYNHATPPSGINATLIAIPVDDERGSSCFKDQWEGINVAGMIALVKRGRCAIADKVKLAKEHGALAVILYNDTPDDMVEPLPVEDGVRYDKPTPGNVSTATLGVDNVGTLVPVGLIALHDGLALTKRLFDEPFNVTLLVDAINEEREGWNVIADTKRGSNDSYIMVGAHYDSSPDSPGLNDNASGVTVILELMRSIKKFAGHKNKVRFAFWGAGKKGQIGSRHYASQLTEEEANKIKFYINLDMIASPKPIFAVYADDEADKVGAEMMLQHLVTKQPRAFWHVKKPSYPAFYAKHDNASDHVAFRSIGIPTSGISTGRTEENDRCHGLRCDDVYNIWGRYNLDALEDIAQAIGFTVASLALNASAIPPRKEIPARKDGMLRTTEEWANTRRMVERERPGGEGTNVV